MCGIAGVVDFGRRSADELSDALGRMQRALRHRGPDDAGLALLNESLIAEGREALTSTRVRTARGPSVAFAHARLAIIDLSARGHQPMQSSNGRDWLVYNGELYNYQELRTGLASRGIRFRSTSDSETLLESLSADGVSALQRLRGMFAFAWWNESERRLLLARDRFGIKPLLVARPSPDLIVFASESRAIAASGYIELVRDDDAMAAVLARGSVPAEKAFWNGVQTVPPGGWVSFDENGSTVGRYWSLEDTLLRRTEHRTSQAAADNVQPALVESVQAHLVSDVAVGVFLSGGLDSTALLAAARQVTSGPLRTFTVTMPGSPLDEAQHARAAAAHFGSDHTELSLDGLDVDAALDEFFDAMQSPTLDGLNTFLVSRAARKAGARVVLSGVGADEMLGGYGSFAYVPKLHRLRSRYGAAARLGSRLLSPIAPRIAEKLSRVFSVPAVSVTETWWRSRQLFSDAEIEMLTGRPAPPPPTASADAADFDQVRYCEFRFFLESQLLGDADAFSMCRALELRTPFVDHVFVDAVIAAGRWSPARGLSHKATLFNHMPQMTMPGAVYRRKQGFVLPFDAWIREALTSAAPKQFRDVGQRLGAEPYRPYVSRYLAGGLHWSRIWILYVLDRLGHSRNGEPAPAPQVMAS